VRAQLQQEGDTDVTNVDDEFKLETPKDTPVVKGGLQQKLNFADFTYVGSVGPQAATNKPSPTPSALTTTTTAAPTKKTVQGFAAVTKKPAVKADS